MLAGYVTCSRTAASDSGRVGGMAMAVASGMRAVGGSRVCWRRLAAGTSGTAPVRAPLGVPAAWKRWPVRAFRVRRRRCAYGEWRHCAASGREGCGAGGQKHAPAAFLSRRTVRRRPARGPRRSERPPTSRGRRRARPRSIAEGPGGNRRRTGGTRPTGSRPLRPFPSAAPLDPSLYEKRGRSEGRRSAAEGKRRSRRPGAAFRGLPRPPVDPGGAPGWRDPGRGGGIRAVAAGHGTGTARPMARHRGLSRR